MTEQTNVELLAEVRERRWGKPDFPEMLDLMHDLAERLEAADQRAEVAEKDRRYETEQKMKLAAVVEGVRVADSASISWDHFGHLVMDLLATAPADALREHDAALIDSLIEGIGSGTYTHQVREGIEVALDQLHAAKAELREEQS